MMCYSFSSSNPIAAIADTLTNGIGAVTVGTAKEWLRIIYWSLNPLHMRNSLLS